MATKRFNSDLEFQDPAQVRGELDVESTTQLDAREAQLTAARIAADNRRAFAGGVALDGGQSEFAEIGDEFSLLNGDKTVSFWAKTIHTNNDVIAYGGWTTSGWGVLLRNSGFFINLKSNSGDYYAVSTSNDYTDGVWRHYSITFEDILGTPVISLLVNGEVVPLSVDVPKTGTYTEVYNHGLIGARFAGSSINFVSSSKFELRNTSIFNRALSATEAAAIAEQGIEAWLAEHPENKWGRPELITNGNFADFTGTADDQTNDSFTGWTILNETGGANYVDAITDSLPSGFTTAVELRRDSGQLNPIVTQEIDVSGVSG
ncbi:LamG-like jellyroll fold domain-containing protein, partial [Marivita sp.]|uniref:LamG-like jellyroll fold domain-containing protein n=1 Tax=Marivita sp. TaxID=2003365 RepID=UPI0025C4E595